MRIIIKQKSLVVNYGFKIVLKELVKSLRKHALNLFDSEFAFNPEVVAR